MNISDAFSAEVSGTREKMQNAEREAEDKLNSIKELYNLTADNAISGEFSRSAVVNRNSAGWWRMATLGFLLLGAFVVGWDVIFNDTGGLDLTSRISIALALIPLTTYAAFQSGRFRYQAERYQTTALQLNALAPYLSDLPEEERNEVLKKAAENLLVKSALHDTRHVTGDAKGLFQTNYPDSLRRNSG